MALHYRAAKPSRQEEKLHASFVKVGLELDLPRFHGRFKGS